MQEVEPSVEDLFVSFVDKQRKARLREQLRALDPQAPLTPALSPEGRRSKSDSLSPEWRKGRSDTLSPLGRGQGEGPGEGS